MTTDLHHSCTVKHTGTSASAPMAAAIIALALEANPSLTWRDVQHIIVKTSQPQNLKATDWRTNGMGRKVSHSYGYGLMDATAMVRLAKNWTLVPRQVSKNQGSKFQSLIRNILVTESNFSLQEKCVVSSPYYYKVIPAMGYVTIEMEVEDCPGVRRLEHVRIIYLFSQKKTPHNNLSCQLRSMSCQKPFCHIEGKFARVNE